MLDLSELTFPIHPEGSLIDIAKADQLGQGVRGLALATAQGDIYIICIEAEIPGSGDVGRWLDTLPVGIRISNVVSRILAGMLHRRGWRCMRDEEVDVWEKA